MPAIAHEEALLDEEELARLARADAGEPLQGPVPTQVISNGEFSPPPQSEAQRRTEHRIRDLVETAAARHGGTVGDFLRTPGAIAASLHAMNETHGRYFDVRPEEVDDAGARRERGLPSDVLVVDDQLHVVKFSAAIPIGLALRAYAQGPSSGWPAHPLNWTSMSDELGETWSVLNPALVGLPVTPEAFQLTQFIKDVWLDSATHVGIISNSPIAAGGPFFPRSVEEAMPAMLVEPAQGLWARDFINQLAGSTRCLLHGQLFLGRGNLAYMEHQIATCDPDGWKGYNIAFHAKADLDPRSAMKSWRHDDEAVAYPTWELIQKHARARAARKPGFRNVCVHKGLAPGTPPAPENGHPGDLPKAARDFPDLNFVTYHACYKPVFAGESHAAVIAGATREGVPDIEWTTLYAQLVAPYPNCYAEIGATFGMMVVTFPTLCAHLLGQLLKYLGEDRILWGTDSVWWGSPQWQIEAFWRFHIPETLREKYGYPELSERARRKILGLNAARLWGLAPDVRAYGALPAGYSARFPDDLRRTWRFPGTEVDLLDPARFAATQGEAASAGAPGFFGAASGAGQGTSAGQSGGPRAAGSSGDRLDAIKQVYVESGEARGDNIRHGWMVPRDD